MKRILIATLVFILLIPMSIATAQENGFGLQNSSTASAETDHRPARTSMESGSYCVSCHTPGDLRLENVTAWMGGIDRSVYSPCPAALRIQEELYYTERLLLAASALQGRLPGAPALDRTATRLEASEQAYSRLLDTPITSLEAFVLEAQMLRYQLGKTYSQLSQIEESLKARNILLGAALVTLIVLLSLGWGLWNTQKALLKPPSTSAGANAVRNGIPTSRAALIFFVLVLFALPFLRTQAVEEVTTSEEEQVRLEALDSSSRAASTADRALARSWIIAAVGAAWEPFEGQQASEALASALAAARESQYNTAALWGRAQAAYEVSAGTTIDQEKAGLVAAQIEASRSRAWGLRLIAHEWSSVDPEQAQVILEEALLVTRGSSGVYQDLDRRALAVAWAEFDLSRSIEVADLISDPALKAWGLREIAGLAHSGSQSSEIYLKAAQSARLVSSPVQRARLLAEIGRDAGQSSLFAEALQALAEIDGQPRAFALSELAAISGDQALAWQIDPAYPVARTAGLHRTGQFAEAWSEAANIADPYERALAQSVITTAWQNAGTAGEIAIPILRDRAKAAVAISTVDKILADGIVSPYYRVQAFTGLQETSLAFEEASNLQNHYPLVALGSALAPNRPGLALEIVDLLEREADKSLLLTAIFASSKERDLFERASGMAIAARVRGDALSPARASLELARAAALIDPYLARQALMQAQEAAERISTK